MKSIKNLIRLLCLLGILLGVSAAQAGPALSVPMPESDPSSEHSINLELAGHLGGIAIAVALQDNYAFLATPGELAVLDVSDPAHPTRVGYAAFPIFANAIMQMVVAKSRVYIASSDVGLLVVDVTNPLDPAYLGVLKPPGNGESSFSGIAIYGDYAYFIKSATVWIYDLSQPGLPQQVGSFANPSTRFYTAIAVSGHYAYTLDNNYISEAANLQVLDLADPLSPTLAGSLDGLVGDVLAVSGSVVYIAGSNPQPASYDGLLQIVDVSNPGSPSLVRSVQVPFGFINRVVVLGQTLVAVSPVKGESEGLLVYNLQDPTHPVLEGSVRTRDGAYDVSVSTDSKYAYVADYGSGLRVIDLSNPAQMVEVGAYDPFPVIRSMGIAGGFVYASSGIFGIHSFGLSNPADPKIVGFIPSLGDAYDLHVSGDFAYTVDGGIRIINITDPAQMKEIALVGGSFDRLVLGEGYLYAWRYYHAGPISVIDIRDPYHPVQVATYDPGYINDMAFTGHTAYIAGPGNSCLIVDFSDPQNPKDEGECSQDSIEKIEISGSFAYLIPQASLTGVTMRILDIRDPAAPVQVGEYIISKSPFDNQNYTVSVYGNLAFLYGYDVSDLVVVDVSNPYAPHQVGSYENGHIYKAIRDGDKVYLGGDGGLSIMNMSPALNGRVTDASRYPVSGARIESSLGVTATTGIDGSYVFANLVSGSYVITPTLSGFVSVPPSRSITMPYNGFSQDFTLLPEPVSVTAAPGITATLAYTGYQGDSTQFEISSGSFSQPAQVMITPTIGANLPAWAFTGHAFELSAQDSQGPILDFAAPVTATISYTDFDVRFVTDESQLILYRWDGGDWVDAATCTPASAYTRDPSANQISLPICQPGKYALYGPTHAILLPAILMNHH